MNTKSTLSVLDRRASNGHGAFTLAVAGAKVLMLEAGRNYD